MALATRKIRLRLRGYDAPLLDKNVATIVDVLKSVGCSVIGPIPLPKRIRRYTVLRSPHVNKDSREQFEMRVHKRLLDILDPSPEVMNTLMKLELSMGVGVEIEQ